MKWILIISTIAIFNIVAVVTPRRFKFADIYVTVLIAVLAASMSDHYAAHKYHSWGFFNKERADLSTCWIYFLIYPAATSLIINWYPYESSLWKKFGYLMVLTAFSTAYEALALKLGIVWHEKWNLWKSLMLYPFIYYLLIVHVRFHKWLQLKS